MSEESHSISKKYQLTEKQKSAVISSSKKIAVIAGKTAVLTERICHLITQCNVGASEILALTFTNKAAKEMQKRVIANLGMAYDKLNIGTFHKLGLHILRAHSELIGYENDFEMASPKIKNDILREILYNASNLSQISYMISCIKNGINDYIAEMDYEIYEKYNTALKERGMLDLDDLICQTVLLLENNPQLCEYYQNCFKYICLDEFQDINIMQNKLIQLISNGNTNIFVVGDDDQCIYEWRGSAPQLLNDFIKDKNVEVIRLEDNFRSESSIVNISGNFIRNNANRIMKKFSPRKRTDESKKEKKIRYTNFKSDEAEGKSIALEIQRLQNEYAYSYEDFAILIRSQKQATIIAQQLKENGIPCYEHIHNDNGFNEFIRVLVSVNNIKKDKTILYAMNYPNRVIGNIAYKKLVEENGWQGVDNYQIYTNMRNSFVDFKNKDIFIARYDLLHNLNSERNSLKASEIIERLIKYYENEDLNVNEEKRLKIALAKETYEIAKKYESDVNTSTLQDFLDYLQFIMSAEDEAEIHENSVNIMTCHKAKGLEFPVVFIPGVQVGVFPNDYFVKDEKDLEQERRLFYVTMTRAIDLLYISCYDNPLYVPPSNSVIKKSFVAELSKDIFK